MTNSLILEYTLDFYFKNVELLLKYIF